MPAVHAPRYQQLAEQLRREIASGKYAVGALLPPELELSGRYAVSRHTVREAIRRLAGMGLITRHQGIGTRVKALQVEPRYTASLTDVAELFQYTQRTRLKVLGERAVEAGPALAALLHCKPGQRWLKFETCRYPIGAGTPISHTEIYILAAYERIRSQLEGPGVWVYGLIEQHYGERIVEVQQEIGAVAIAARVAKLLGAPARTPGLHVVRRYYGNGERLLSVSVNVYAAERFKLSTRWRLEGQ